MAPDTGAPPERRRLILRNGLSPGDIVMLTAAVRDLHACHPGRFLTDVRTPCPHLWENNPHITPLSEEDPGVEVIDCEYPLIHESNQTPYHFVHGFARFLGDRLGVEIRPTAHGGDLHVSDLEKSWYSQVREITGEDIPFWIVVAGGKRDYTIKWWDAARFQEVVDRFEGRILFVQVGEEGHHHPPLRGVLDLRGKTDLRQLVRLVYHAQGVLCPVTLAMHLAAAVEVKGGFPKSRPCVVVAGGREPVNWEAYPHHQFVHTLGALPCCDLGGCWKARTVPLGDGDEKDHPDQLCVDVVGTLPRCMDMITPTEVARRIETYFDGGVIPYLDGAQARVAARAVDSSRPTVTTAKSSPRAAAPADRALFLTVSDRAFFPGTLAAVNGLKRFHPRAEIVVVDNGIDKPGLTAGQRSVLEAGGSRIVEAEALDGPGRKLAAWELKAYAARDLSRNHDLLVGFDSDCLLCGPIDDVMAEALRTGRFMGGRDWQDGEGVDYGDEYAAYGIRVPVHNDRYMSTSIYFCPLTRRNRGILEEWALCTNRARYNGLGTLPGHGDQGVLNALLYRDLGPDGVGLLPNALWSQHWRFWTDEIVFSGGVFLNRSTASGRQRAFHISGVEKYWDISHARKVRGENRKQATAFAWFLFLLFFAGLGPGTAEFTDLLPRESWHLIGEMHAYIESIRAFDAHQVGRRWPALRRALQPAPASIQSG